MDFILTSFNFNKKVGVHIFQTKINKYKELRFTKLYNPRFWFSLKISNVINELNFCIEFVLSRIITMYVYCIVYIT